MHGNDPHVLTDKHRLFLYVPTAGDRTRTSLFGGQIVRSEGGTAEESILKN